MRRTKPDPIATSAFEAQHEAVRADTPAARTTGLSPRMVPVAGDPPTSVTGTVLSRVAGGTVRWLSAHGLLSFVAGLVAVTSLATALLVAHGARQLNVSPRQATTPYLAAPPKGPVEVPTAASGPPTADDSPSERVGRKPRDRSDRPDRRRSTKRDGRTPERAPVPDVPPRPPASHTEPPPPSAEPTEPTHPEERCRIGLRLLGRCVLGSPHTPGHRRHAPGHRPGLLGARSR